MKSSRLIEKCMAKRWVRSKRRRYERRVSRILANMVVGGALGLVAPALSTADSKIIDWAETGQYDVSDGDSLTITSSGSITSSDNGVMVSAVSAYKINNQGTITAESSGIEVYSEASVSEGIVNSGTIDATYVGIMVTSSSSVQGGITNGDGGTITGSDHYGIEIIISEVEGGITNEGSISVERTAISIESSTIDGGITNSGIINAGTVALFADESSTINGGITNNGIINGGLEVDAAVDFRNAAILNVGETEDNKLGGTFTQEANGRLELKLLPASGYTESIFSVKGANLDGTLNISFAGGFSLSEGDTIELMDIDGTLSGTFNNYAEGSSLGTFGNLSLNLTYAGDDGNDVVAYALAAIPEPATLTLLALGGLPLLVRRCK